MCHVHVLNACAYFRLPEVTASFSDEPHALVLASDDNGKILTSSNFASSSLIASELLPDMSSITYHPNPLIVSHCVFFFCNDAASNYVILIIMIVII